MSFPLVISIQRQKQLIIAVLDILLNLTQTKGNSMNTIIKSLFILFIAVYFLNSQTIPPDILEQLKKEESSEFKREREKWLEDMHRTEPGVNWRVIEKANSIARSEYLLKQMQSMNNQKYPFLQEESEIVAGGYLKGKWIEKGSNNQAGRIHLADVDFERGLIYAASSGGNVWRGYLDGSNWVCLNNSLKISNIRSIFLIKKGKVDRVLVVGNSPSACYFTDDEGRTWQKSKGLEKAARWGGLIRGIRIGDTPVFYLLALEWDYDNWKPVTSIYISRDYGENFSLCYTFSNTNVSHCDIFSPKFKNSENFEFYFINKDSLFLLNSLLESKLIRTFSNFDEFKTISQVQLKGIYRTPDDFLAIMLTNESRNTYFFASTDAGKTWQKRGSLNFGPFDKNSFEVSYANPDIWYFGEVDAYRSFDRGLNWTKVNGWSEYYGDPLNKLHADIPGIQSFKTPDNEELILISTDGGIYQSYDNMRSVENLSLNDLNVSQYYSSYTYQNADGIIFAGSQDQGFQRCLNDSGKVLGFEQTISGDYGHLTSSDGGDNLWSVYPGFAMLYQNAYKINYSAFYWNFSTYNFINWLWMPPILADPLNPKAAYVAAGGKDCPVRDNCSYLVYLELVDNTIKHKVLPFNFGEDGSRLSAIAISQINKNFFYALTNTGKFYYSTNKGNDWIKNDSLKGPESHYFYGSSIIPSKLQFGKIYIAGSGYSTSGAFVSTDNGLTFIPIDEGLPKTLIYKIAISDDEKYIFAATEAGPYVFIVEQNKWFTLASKNSPDQTYWSVEYIPNLRTARFVTYGRGIWDFKIEEVLSKPDELHLSYNIDLKVYPNPAEKYLMIELNTSNHNSNVLIYDIEGKLIQKFDVSNNVNEIKWDLTDFSGHRVVSGNYLIFLVSNDQVKFKKVVIEK
ncbi:MAG: T9SS type A sorting domain-containing protein [Candidatus Kapabacteria bacterium]|nr:T9SS type A sorting domain-containing protein [Candidatus Kapabacteria bacterium]